MSFLRQLLRACLSSFQWYRRHVGGHWELWWVDHPFCVERWFQTGICTHDLGDPVCDALGSDCNNPDHWELPKRPHPLCRSRPVCEHYHKDTQPKLTRPYR